MARKSNEEKLSEIYAYLDDLERTETPPSWVYEDNHQAVAL